MENKITTKFLCLEEPDFYELVDRLYERLKGKNIPDRWISGDEAMRLLNISSPTTLQKLRDTPNSGIRFSQPSRKLILYDRESLEEYLEKHANKTS